MAEVSVIVPVYKVEKYIRKCVDSILVQTFHDFELILVDDGSPDKCGEICDRYAMSDNRVHVIHQANQGLSAARNAGIDYALTSSASNYLTFVDSDDWVSDGYLAELRNGVRHFGSVACVNCTQFYDDGREFTAFRNTMWKTMDTQDYWCHPDCLTVVAWGKLYPKAFFEDIRYPVGRVHEDLFTTHKILFQAPSVAVRFEPLYHYRCRQGSIMNSGWSKARLDEVQAMIEQCAFLRERGFEKAYLFSRAFLLGTLSGLLSNKDIVLGNLKAKFEAELFGELKRRPMEFWRDRGYYRNTMRHGFWIRWACGMIYDLVKSRRRSWLLCEFLPVVRQMYFSFHKKCWAR